MKLFPLLLALPSLFFAACGGGYRSTLHDSADWKAYRADRERALPEVTLPVGERTLAFEHKMSLIPMPGGFNGTLLPENPRLVHVEYKVSGANSRTYLTGLRPGRTRVFLVNGMAHGGRLNGQLEGEESALSPIISPYTPSYQLRVTAD
ncbi:hypothetical protein [Roseibacillus ishigakijimensis]|uniref:Uncharacterized protein n=1 Tax=Roseibacillus ishigakijimensis TaxID=454146 RepID=A0A934RW81_9BACT|nr:hypothetical protein [Roseibacillus ishigakijimensis]MBK1835290.1 hypothetical protein [Roseibacillus ishigakijimensis]